MLLESHKPLDMIIIMLGTNDLKARFSLTAFDIAGGVERLVQVILQFKCGISNPNPAILISCPPRVDPQNDLDEMFSGAKQKSVNLPASYNQIAEKYNSIFLDLNTVIKVDHLDGIHYSQQAHRMLGNKMADLVSSYFSLK
jgi:lysophospholipase L1-like esterase